MLTYVHACTCTCIYISIHTHTQGNPHACISSCVHEMYKSTYVHTCTQTGVHRHSGTPRHTCALKYRRANVCHVTALRGASKGWTGRQAHIAGVHLTQSMASWQIGAPPGPASLRVAHMECPPLPLNAWRALPHARVTQLLPVTSYRVSHLPGYPGFLPQLPQLLLPQHPQPAPPLAPGTDDVGALPQGRHELTK